jgi:hypothetical protein
LRRNGLVKYAIESQITERIEMKGRRRRTHKKLVDDFKETRIYWKLKKGALDRTLRKSRFGRRYEHAGRRTAERRKNSIPLSGIIMYVTSISNAYSFKVKVLTYEILKFSVT